MQRWGAAPVGCIDHQPSQVDANMLMDPGIHRLGSPPGIFQTPNTRNTQRKDISI